MAPGLRGGHVVMNGDFLGSQGGYFLGVGKGTGSQGASGQAQGLKETTA